MIKAKSDIIFRSNGQIISYKSGDTVSPLHLHFLKTYYSGQIIDEKYYINPIIPINKKSNITVNRFDELKKSIDSTKDLVLSLKNSIENSKESIKERTSTIEPVIPKEKIQSEGLFGEQVSKGSSIKSKVKKLKSMEKK